jgi:putative membrane protein
MIWIANILVALVAALHLYFLVLEMFLWTKPLGLKTFRNSPEKAAETAVLAANQGLYNGFLTAGLIWGLVEAVPAFAFQIKMFFFIGVIAITDAVPHVLALPHRFLHTLGQRWHPIRVEQNPSEKTVGTIPRCEEAAT